MKLKIGTPDKKTIVVMWNRHRFSAMEIGDFLKSPFRNLLKMFKAVRRG